ncbi:unnamed protein product [Rhizoctonia solani]|uniref:Uncharacterized protein n=1 Tax=Rhizoctonia solani TaxID=456999 RepID=A0A8H3BEB2_9AGAM|nr:unnamed protein product [Rhizoctonia solani]
MTSACALSSLPCVVPISRMGYPSLFSLQVSHQFNLASALLLDIQALVMSTQPNTHETPAWFGVSLSRSLHTLAQNAHAILPADADVCASLDQAAGLVYFHESCINDMQTLGLVSDPLFIYSGYTSAVEHLLKVAKLPGFEGTIRSKICRDLSSYLKNILAVIYKNGGNVAHLFEDPDMRNLLIGLARLL